MNAVEERILAHVDAEGLLICLRQLVAIPSVTGEETEAQRFVAEVMRGLHLDVDQWEIDIASLTQHPAYSAEVDRKAGLGVVGAMGLGDGPSLILNGHVDVVPPGDLTLWHTPPWEATVVGDQVVGRGSLDMKGGLVCALFAAKAIQEAGIRLQGRLLIESVIGEEDGGAGTLAAILRGYQADAAVIMEPTSLTVAPAQAGALNFRVTIPGQSAHGALRGEGVSAIEKFAPIYQAIVSLEERRNQANSDPRFAAYRQPYPICVGTLRAGDWASSVPDWLTFEGRYGVAVGENLMMARRQLEQAIEEAARADGWLREHPPRLEWWGGQFSPAGIPVDHALVSGLLESCEAVTGRRPPVAGMPYGADMHLLVNQGSTPTVLFGPGDIRLAHRPNESVPIKDLLAVTRTLAILAARHCGVAR